MSNKDPHQRVSPPPLYRVDALLTNNDKFVELLKPVQRNIGKMISSIPSSQTKKNMLESFKANILNWFGSLATSLILNENLCCNSSSDALFVEALSQTLKPLHGHIQVTVSSLKSETIKMDTLEGFKAEIIKWLNSFDNTWMEIPPMAQSRFILPNLGRFPFCTILTPDLTNLTDPKEQDSRESQSPTLPKSKNSGQRCKSPHSQEGVSNARSKNNQSLPKPRSQSRHEISKQASHKASSTSRHEQNSLPRHKQRSQSRHEGQTIHRPSGQSCQKFSGKSHYKASRSRSRSWSRKGARSRQRLISITRHRPRSRSCSKTGARSRQRSSSIIRHRPQSRSCSKTGVRSRQRSSSIIRHRPRSRSWIRRGNRSRQRSNSIIPLKSKSRSWTPLDQVF